MVSRRKRSNSSVGNKLNNLTDKVTEQQKLQQVSGTQTNAVTNDSIALGAVNTESVADRSITSAKIGRGEVTSENLGVINEIVASGGLDIETGVDGHLSLSGGKYEEPYDGIEDPDGYKILAFDPADNTVKVIDNTPVVSLDDIDDVNVTGVTDGQVLTYDSATELWGPISVTGTGTVTSVDTGVGLTGGPITTSGTISLDADLNDLTDTTITGTPADNELLAYDSGTSQWINQTADEAGIVQVYEQDTAPTGKVGDLWIDTSVNYPIVPVGLTPIIPASVVVGSGTATVNENGKVTFSGCSSLALNGVFSSKFDNYKIIFNATGGGTPLSHTLRMRAAGVNTSTSNYLRGAYISYGINTGSGNYNSSTDVGFLIGYSTTAFGTDSVIDLIDPAKTAVTRAHWSLNGYDANHFTLHAGGTHPVATAYDGFGITLSSSVFNGGLQVYGYN